jgi:protocatechuate 3,4-dioxygenase beta subunit
MLGSLHLSLKQDSRSLCIILVLWLGVYSASAWAQTQLATVFGTITDPAGAVIAEAKVSVSSIRTGLKRVALTDTNGQYHVAGLAPGMYSVRAEKEKV